MQRIFSNFRDGDIVILELPFTDMLGSKLRPVLVLSCEELNSASDDVIVAKISSSSHLPDFEVRIESKDLEEGKLKRTSYIHCHSIFTVEKNLVIKKVGRLRNEKMSEVRDRLRKVFRM